MSESDADAPRPVGRPVEIYGLFDPHNGELRYIGKANDAQKRLASHIRDSRHQRVPLHSWVRKLSAVDLRPDMRVLLRCAPSGWEEAERFLISEAREANIRLLNVADGGDQPGGRGTDFEKHVWYLKNRVKEALRRGHVSESAKAKLRRAAALRPDLFGCFADV